MFGLPLNVGIELACEYHVATDSVLVNWPRLRLRRRPVSLDGHGRVDRCCHVDVSFQAKENRQTWGPPAGNGAERNG